MHALARPLTLSALAGLAACAKPAPPESPLAGLKPGVLEVVDQADPNAEVLALRFGWPSSEALTEHTRTRSGAGSNDVTSAEGYISVESYGSQGARIRRQHSEWVEANGEIVGQSLVGFAIDYAGTAPRDFNVAADGSYDGPADPETWRAVWRDARTFVDEAARQAVEAGNITQASVEADKDTLDYFISASFREGKDAYNWNRAIHTWHGLDLQVGTIYRRLAPGPAGAPALEMLAATEIDDCRGNRPANSCVTLFYMTTTLPTDEPRESDGTVGYASSQIITLMEIDTLVPVMISDTTWSGRVAPENWTEREKVDSLVEHVEVTLFRWVEPDGEPPPPPLNAPE